MIRDAYIQTTKPTKTVDQNAKTTREIPKKLNKESQKQIRKYQMLFRKIKNDSDSSLEKSS